MSLAAFLARFRELHRKDGSGALSPEEKEEYRRGRDELARAVLAVQHLTLKPGETARQSLRVARALQVDLGWPKGQIRTITLDLSIGGFASLMAKAPAQSDVVACVFRLPGGEQLAAKARVVDVVMQVSAARVAFAFQDLPDEDRDRIERVVFDTVLDRVVR